MGHCARHESGCIFPSCSCRCGLCLDTFAGIPPDAIPPPEGADPVLRSYTAKEHETIEKHLLSLGKLKDEWLIIAPQAKRIDDAARSLTELLYALTNLSDVKEEDTLYLYGRIGKVLDGFRQ